VLVLCMGRNSSSKRAVGGKREGNVSTGDLHAPGPSHAPKTCFDMALKASDTQERAAAAEIRPVLLCRLKK
jgi:hypothetical protein